MLRRYVSRADWWLCHRAFLRRESDSLNSAVLSTRVCPGRFNRSIRTSERGGLTSLYNEALGTVSNQYLYDRVQGRDQAPVHKPWQTTV
jgi:hypothetical protein